MTETDLQTFYEDLMQEVVAKAEAHGEYTRTALVDALAGRLISAEELQDWTPCFHEGRGHRNKSLAVDGYCAEELALDGTLHIVVADHRDGARVQVLTTAEVKAAFGRALAFVEDAWAGRLHTVLEPSTPAADLANLIHGSKASIKTLKVLVLSNAVVGARYREVTRSDMDSMKVELQMWDLSRFSQIAETGGREELDIDVMKFLPEGLPALPAGIGEAGYRSYLCVVPGSFLADIYDEYGSRLLEGNVRAFLSTRGKVNGKIRATIAKAPDRFFAFNNGITATATDVVVDSGGRIARIQDLQIVNGGQTTASLYNARARDKVPLGAVFVQMKLSVLSPELALTMIPEISESANTQNKVSDADLFANHPFHRKMEFLSRRLWAPPKIGARHATHWFYERARAQFLTEQAKLSLGEKRAFLLQNPKDQLIIKTDLAKFENTWLKLPHIVSLGAQKNFAKFAESIREAYEALPDRFNERWFQHLVAKAILFHSTERIVSTASWYTNAYRANIVTYGIARMLVLIEDEYPGWVLDLDDIWKRQALPELLVAQLESVAQVAMRVLAAPPIAGANITEWAKKELCWKQVKGEAAVVIAGLKSVLKPLEEERAEVRDARINESESGAISAVVEVVNRSQSGFWSRLATSPKTRRIVSEVEFGILTTAARKGAAFTPSDAQAKKLMAMAKRLEDAGLV